MAERKRGRRWLIALAVVVALLAVGALALRHYARPDVLTALLVEKARSELGAELSLAREGRFGFVPKLHLVLTHPVLKNAQGGASILSGDSAEVLMSWSTLWSDRIEIERIELAKPVLDLDALSAWLASRPPSSSTPDVRFALRVDGATLVSGGKPVASGVSADLASAGDLSAWAQRWRESALLPPLDGTLEAERIEIGGATLEGVRVESRADAPAQRELSERR